MIFPAKRYTYVHINFDWVLLVRKSRGNFEEHGPPGIGVVIRELNMGLQVVVLKRLNIGLQVVVDQ